MSEYPNSPLGLSPHLWDVLACPCPRHGAVVPGESADEHADGEAGEIVCTVCATRFPVRDGIPVMLLDEATPGPNGIGNAGIGAANS